MVPVESAYHSIIDPGDPMACKLAEPPPQSVPAVTFKGSAAAQSVLKVWILLQILLSELLQFPLTQT